MTGRNSISCEGKKQYATYWQANKASKKLNKFRDKAKSGPYNCPYCHSWHVGNTMGDIAHKKFDKRERRRFRHVRI